MSTSKNRKLLDETSDIMRLHHYSIYTERAILRLDQTICTLSRNDLPGRFEEWRVKDQFD